MVFFDFATQVYQIFPCFPSRVTRILTKDFLKARTSDLESFKELFGVFVGKVKEKAPRGLFVRQHERLEEKKNTFSLQDVLQRDRELREQRKAKRKKSHDLER